MERAARTAPPGRLRDQPLVLAAILLVCLPLVVTAVKAGTGHYLPTGDNAIIATRAGDVFSANSPSLGMTSSLSGFSGGQATANHPGPLLYWAFSVPYALSGHSTVGFLIAVLVLQIGSVVLVAFTANRRAGPPLALLALLGAALLSWSLSGPSLAVPLNPFVTVLPFYAFLFVCWALAAGDRWALAVAIALGSLCVQGHLSYGVVVLVVGLAATASFAFEEVRRHRHRREARAAAAEPGAGAEGAGEPPTHRGGPAAAGRFRLPTWAWVAAAAATVVACWGPPLVQQLTAHDGNLAAILSGLGPSGSATHLDPALYGRILWPVVGWQPLWARTSSWYEPVGWFMVVTGVAVLAGLAAATAWAFRRGRRSLARLLLVADAALVGAYLTVRSAPESVDAQSYRYLWAIGPFAWVALAAVGLSLARVPLRRHDLTRRVAPVLLGAVVVIALLGAVSADPGGLQSDRSAERHAAAVSSLTDQLLPKLDHGKTYGLERTGSAAFLSIGPGLVRNLEQRGLPTIHVVDHDVAAYGTGRSSTRGLAGTLLVQSGASPADRIPAGAKVVGRYTSADPDSLPDLQRRIVAEMRDLPAISLSEAGKQFFALLFRFTAQNRQLADELDKAVGQKLTQATLDRLLADPSQMVRSGAAVRLLQSGALGYLAHQRTLNAPSDILELLERYDAARTKAEDRVTVYLVPPGPSRS